jgi:hypothetical protein
LSCIMQLIVCEDWLSLAEVCPFFGIQAALSALVPFQNGHPQYMWLSLINKISGAPAGEVRLRVHWTNQDAGGIEDPQPTLSIQVSLRGIGLSVIEASLVKLPCEVIHALRIQLTQFISRDLRQRCLSISFRDVCISRDK